MDATWPDDVWVNTFDIQNDGSVKVEYDIIMAVPAHEDRPTDYLNFGQLERNFKAIDYETSDILKITIKKREQGQTLLVYPNRILRRGDRYRYKLEFIIPEGFIKRVSEYCYLVEWGWGNWPLEYSIKFILPSKTSVYYYSENLASQEIKRNRPILIFKDRSEHNTSIHVMAMYIPSKKGAIDPLIDSIEDSLKPTIFDVTYVVTRDLKTNVKARIKAQKDTRKVDIPMIFFRRHFSHLSITAANTGEPLKHKQLPVILGKDNYFIWMRVEFSERMIKEKANDIQVNFIVDARDSMLSKTGNIFRVLVDLGNICAQWKIKFVLPEKMAVFFASPDPVKYKINNDMPIIYFDFNTDGLRHLASELLFRSSSHSTINLGYRFIEADVPKVVENDKPFSLPFQITNTLTKSCDFTIQIELNGFQDSTITRKIIALSPGDSRNANIVINTKMHEKIGFIQFWVHAEGFQTEVTENYEITFLSKTTRINRCFKIGVQSCPRNDIKFKPRTVFIGMPYREPYEDHFKFGILPVLEEFGLKDLKSDEEITNIDLMCKICGHIQETEYAIINLSSWNPNVLLELGILYGLGKNVLLIKYTEEKEMAVDLEGMERCEYSKIEELKASLRKYFKRFL